MLSPLLLSSPPQGCRLPPSPLPTQLSNWENYLFLSIWLKFLAIFSSNCSTTLIEIYSTQERRTENNLRVCRISQLLWAHGVSWTQILIIKQPHHPYVQCLAEINWLIDWYRAVFCKLNHNACLVTNTVCQCLLMMIMVNEMVLQSPVEILPIYRPGMKVLTGSSQGGRCLPFRWYWEPANYV